MNIQKTNVLIPEVLPKFSYLAARRESYQIALLRRARVKWERSVAKVLDALEKVK